MRTFLSFGAVGLTILVMSRPAMGQSLIVPDDTLGAEGSVVTEGIEVRGALADRIDGGALRDANLFHSFLEFNVNEGQRVYFGNPADVANIFSRVTGSNPSDILGTLGVDGAANLFFLNPNGIVFGESASLDVEGSFVGSAGSSFIFPDGSEFSAVTPGDSSLLTVSVPLGLQYGPNPPGATIRNRGAIATGQDLTLSADVLDLEGQVFAGGDLTLLATDLLQIRDSVDEPFVAASGGEMLVQGTRSVDIFALSHPESGLFSGGDMVLRSANAVGGDAHYWSGGSFRVEQQNVDLGSLESISDPIIRVNGDVEIAGYFGPSLHVLASGSIFIPGDITITGADTVGDSISPDNPDPDIAALSNIVLSDGTSVVVNGSENPSLDLRAGVSLENLGSPIAVDNEFPFGLFLDLSTAVVTGASINTGNISIALPDAFVLITNKDRGDESLSGAIQIGEINVSSLIGDSGSIYIDSSSEIRAENIAASGGRLLGFGDAGTGGDIRLLAEENIEIGSIDSSSLSIIGSSDNGGNVLLKSGGSIFAGNVIASSDSFTSGSTGSGGTVSLIAEADISVENIDSHSGSTAADALAGGNITLTASGNISTANISSYSIAFLGGNSSNAGDISINSGGDVIVESIRAESFAFSNDAGSNGGTVSIDALSNISTGDISASSFSLSANPDLFGRSGNINLTSREGRIRTNGLFIDSENQRGTISLTAESNIEISPGSIDDDNVRIDAFGQGAGGTISLLSRAGTLVITDGIIRSDVSPGGIGEGGNISLTARDVILTNTEITSAVEGRGDAGSIVITADNSILLNFSRLFTSVGLDAVGQGGNISLNSNLVELNNFSFVDTSTIGLGDAGNISLKSDSNAILIDSAVFSITAGQGDAGSVAIDSGNSVHLANSNVSTAVDTLGVGNGGDIEIASDSLELLSGSQLQATTRGRTGDLNEIGNSGDIFLDVTDNLAISGSNSSGFLSGIYTSSESKDSGLGGAIEVIGADSLVVTGGALISSQTFSDSDGGTISINVGDAEFTSGGQITANTIGGGQAGSILLESDSLLISGSDPNFSTRPIPIPSLRDRVDILTPRVILETEPNESISAAQNIDSFFSLDSREDTNPNVELSTRAPYVSLGGRISNAEDYFSFTIERAGTRGIFDVDTGEVDASAGGTTIALFDEQGNQLELENNSPADLGAEGSQPLVFDFTDTGFGLQTGFQDSVDPYLSFTFSSPGTYFVRVSGVASDTYNLNVSLDAPNVTGSSVGSGAVSGLFAESEGVGDSGSIQISTPEIVVRDSAQISVSALQQGDPGLIQIQNGREVSLSGGSSISTEILEGASVETPGNIEIQAVTLTLENSEVTATTAGQGSAGNIVIRGADNVDLIGSEIASEVTATGQGQGGTVDIRSNIVSLTNQSALSSSTAGIGNSGEVIITAPGSIILSGSSEITTTVEPMAEGDAQQITLQTAQLTLNEASQISAATSGVGSAGAIDISEADTIALNDSTISTAINRNAIAPQPGSITINTRSLHLNNGADITASTAGQGDAGAIQVSGADSITLTDSSTVTTEILDGAIAQNPSNINIQTQSLVIENSGIAATTAGQGNAGNIVIRDADDVTLSGSEIASEVTETAQGRGGVIDIQSNTLSLTNESAITASTAGRGRAGDISVTATDVEANQASQIRTTTSSNQRAGDITVVSANSVSLDGSDTGFLASTAQNSSGDGGDIAVHTQHLGLTDNAAISSESLGTGTAGNVNIQADEKLQLENSRLATSAAQSAGGAIDIRAEEIFLSGVSDIETDVEEGLDDGGNIRIVADFIQLEDDSDIRSNTNSGTGDGGNIEITADAVIAFDDSDIIASAPQGRGGDIFLDTPAFFGENFTPNAFNADPDTLEDNDRADINATGAINGAVTIPDVSFIQNSLADLPEGVINTESLIANSCVTRNEDGSSTFNITGAEGLRDRPGNAATDYPTGEVQAVPEAQSWQPGDPIVEPQGIYQLPNGELVLSHQCQ